MSEGMETLSRIRSLERLYQQGYRSRVIDATIDKLVAMESMALQRELSDLEERLHVFEAQYHMASDDFYPRFRAGEMGDSADMFEWSAFCQMRSSILKRLETLRSEAA
jgi:hypothetical protein